MSNSENSFADRLSRARAMKAALSEFTPAFVPADANLAAGAFESYLNGVEGANDAVADAEVLFTGAADARRDAAEAMQDKALRVKDHVGANVTWKKYLSAVEEAAKLVRGTRRSPRPKPAPPGAVPPPKPRQGALSQTGFADIASNFGKLLAAVKKVTGYTAAAASGLTIAELTAQDTAYAALNATATTAEAELDEAQRQRGEYYDGENGLHDKMVAIKKAVRSQYGAGSTEYAAVKVIKV